jgi:hypothetical protein
MIWSTNVPDAKSEKRNGWRRAIVVRMPCFHVDVGSSFG